MIPIIKREISSFFSNIMGYLVIGIFLLINGLFLWVFKGGYNIFDAGFADLTPLFELAPWILLFLIPAVTMRAFSEEIKMGTFELLVTKPVSLPNIVLGKYFGAVILVCLAILPTLLYILTISNLGNPEGNWDVGSTLGSYLGLFFLVLGYTAIGIFTSTLSQNQIVAFIIAVLCCFLLYYGFDSLGSIFNIELNIASFGMKTHFDSMGRGVLDTRDIIYFLSIVVFFIALTIRKLQKRA
ncbi:MAG: ABC-2 type transport system permease protein [Candidatus Latescibacterota bacterium]